MIEEVRKNWPQTKPISVRVSADDYIEGGINIDMMVDYINMIKDKVDLIDVSSGGLLSADITYIPDIKLNMLKQLKTL